MAEEKEQKEGAEEPLPIIAVADSLVPEKASDDGNSGAGMQSLRRMAGIMFMCLRIVIIVILVYLFLSGIFRVDEQNEAMLFRFGALQSRLIENEERSVLTSGNWYWAWPYPIDWVKVLPAQRTVTVSTETRFEPWLKPEPGQEPNRFLRPGSDGYLLTGDTNIIHATCEVNYRIGDPQKYYLDFLDDEEAAAMENAVQRANAAKKKKHSNDDEERPPEMSKRGTEAIMRNMLSNAVIQVCSTWTVEDLRTKIQHDDNEIVNVEERVQAQLEKYLKKVDLGVEIQSVKMSLELPHATLKAFEGVFEASEMGNAEIQKARLDASTMLSTAEGLAAKIRNDALTYKRNLVESIRADSMYFKTVLEEYKKNPETMLTVLYSNALRSALTKVDNKYVIHEKQGGQEVRLQIGQVPEKDKASQTAP